jgi:hypothetical protein
MGKEKEGMPPTSEVRQKIPGLEIWIIKTKTGGRLESAMHDDMLPERDPWNVAMDTLEAILLAHSCAGIDVTGQVYADGLSVAVDAIANHLGHE